MVVFHAGVGAGGRRLLHGRVRPRYESDLAFRVGGRIVERRVDVGVVVKPGQLLARLDPADAGQRRGGPGPAGGRRERVGLCRAEVLRYRDLVAKNFVSRSVLTPRRRPSGRRLPRVEAGPRPGQRGGAPGGLHQPGGRPAGVVTAGVAEVGQVVKDSPRWSWLARDGEREVLIAVPESRIASSKKAGHRGAACPARRGAGRPVREIAPSADAATRTWLRCG